MSADADIREAEEEVLRSAKSVATHNQDSSYTMDEAVFLVQRAHEKLAALKSPLPSREDMAERDCAHEDNRGRQANSVSLRASTAERHWADCLRWIADKTITDCLCEKEAVLRSWADELEART